MLKIKLKLIMGRKLTNLELEQVWLYNMSQPRELRINQGGR